MQKEKFSIKKRITSFRYALNGLWQLMRHEHNAWIHLMATIGVLLAGACMHLSRQEWVAVVFAIGLVWAAELFNTCVERLLDHLHPAPHEEVRFIKDLAAGGVLVAAITALLIGLIIFLPKLGALL